MSMTVTTRRPGWWYPLIYVGVFLVVLAVNLVMAYFATHSFTGLETEQAYDKGLAYNEVLAKAKAQQALGWSVDAVVTAHDPSNSSQHDADVTVSFKDKDGKPVTGLSVKAKLVRPTQAGFDQSLELVEQAGGNYASLAHPPKPGQWDLHVVAHKGEIDYEINQRVLVP